MTVVCTIHQPPTETYNLFDRVMYLADGEVAYFGRRDQAQSYFESIGMPCPPYYNMAGRKEALGESKISLFMRWRSITSWRRRLK